MQQPANESAEHRVLFLPPTRRDGQITRALLEAHGVACVICLDPQSLREELRRGAGAVLLTDDAVALVRAGDFLAAFEGQPSWSDVPIVMLVRGGSASRAAELVTKNLTNVTLLERPAPMRTVVSAVQAAVRARAWQFRIRDQFRAVEAAEAYARHLQEQLAVALEASGLGTFHCQMPLDKITWNEQCKAHFWLPPDAEVDFDLFYSILHPDDRDRTRRAIEACVHGRQPYDIEYRTVSPTGEIRWVRATGRTYYNERGEPVRFDGTTQDVTDARAKAEERQALLESERLARAEAERASRMKDEFLANLSHELRTPLNAILGWAQLLSRDNDDKATLEEGLAVIERNARVQTQLIEDLLDMSRIISGTIRLDVQAVDAASIIDAALETVMPAAQAKGIRLQKVLDPHAGPIAGDPGRLQQVVWNLLSNAIKFTPKDGRVQVLLERVNSHVEISVADTGIGIDPGFLPHMFERFRQADASTTRRHGGLGLGLAIVKQLVELHGGTIRAKSPGEGHGSTFTIVLPLAPVRAAHEEQRVHPRSAMPTPPNLHCVSLRGLRVLVVDDEPDARGLIKRLLEECEATVLVAGSAADALGIIDSDPPDVLVSDVGMQEMDGYEFLRRVRAGGNEKAARMPAVALTAFARSEDRTRALLAGFLVHVSKPVEPQELIATIASVAGRTGDGR